MTGKEPVGIYIHVPFCSRKCPYCHFFVLPDSLQQQEFFVDHLLQEWALKAPSLTDTEIVSVYFGGGTPSLLPPSSIQRILDRIREEIPLSQDCEITLEANPEKVDPERVKGYRDAGVNRVSIGVQSFEDRLLRLLGRTHTGKGAEAAVESVLLAGIHNISIDLMYELPGQTPSDWARTVQKASELPITHLSFYNLTFEEGTVFYKNRKELGSDLPSPEESLEMLNRGVDTLKKGGFDRYEISAFAKNGLVSVHNTGYWTGRTYLGLGPSAFSYVNGRRFKNTAHLKKWGEAIARGESAEDFTECLSDEERRKELLAVGLRRLEGVDTVRFQEKYGSFDSDLEKAVAACLEKNSLRREGSSLRLTEYGLLFYDTVASELL